MMINVTRNYVQIDLTGKETVFYGDVDVEENYRYVFYVDIVVFFEFELDNGLLSSEVILIFYQYSMISDQPMLVNHWFGQMLIVHCYNYMSKI